MTEPFPAIEPHDHGLLDVGDGNQVYWEECGKRTGKPALVLHGGPGMGCTARMRRAFDPDRYRIILFDQRGCGRSQPHASAIDTDMRFNTTHHLIADIERLRQLLGVERWLLSGGSWGATLALAYAERYPERVSEIVLASISLSRRGEIDWLYAGVGRFFPEEWLRFRDGVPEAEQADLVAAYARQMERAETRDAAAIRWARWEDAVVSLEPNASPNRCAALPPEALVAFVRICAHYYAHAAWLDEDELLGNAARLRDIPGVLIHGRLDLSCPLGTAWELARAWPQATLHTVDHAGHQGGPSMRELMLRAHAEFSLPTSA